MVEAGLGAQLRRLRIAASMSQADLATRAGVSVEAISALERGARRAPYRHTLEALASALNLSARDRTVLFAAAGRQAAMSGTSAGSSATPVSARPVPLIGREVAVGEVVALMRHGGARLLTLVGPGGVGKTTLALAVGQARGQDFANGQLVVPLADLRDAAQVPAAIGRSLGLDERVADPEGALRESLRHRDFLLILDNCEHILAALDFIAGLLDACPRLQILATSRAPLRLARERVYELPPLEFPEPSREIAVSALAEYSAPALFVARAQEADPTFVLTQENSSTVATICARLDGLPLALELAAARLQRLTPTELLARLGERLPLVNEAARDRPARHQTLRATIAWSHDLLPPGERALFCRLAVFVGGATLAAIEAVCAPPAPLSSAMVNWLGGLLEQRLIYRATTDMEGATRFAMLETIREYAAEALAASAEMQTYQRRHSAYFLARAEEAAPHLTGPESATWMVRLEADHDNLRAALRRALDDGDAETALRLGAAVWRFWYNRGAYNEARRWLRAVLALPVPGDALLTERAAVFRAAGGIAIFQGEFGPAGDQLQAALDLAQRGGDKTGIAVALDYLGLLARHQNDLPMAIRRHEEALAAHQALGEPRGIGVSLNNLGGVYEGASDYRRAAAAFTAGLQYSRAAADGSTVLLLLANLGEVLLHLGEYAEARAQIEEALALARQASLNHNIAIALTNLGALSLDHGDPLAARTYFTEAYTLRRAQGLPTLTALAVCNLGETARLLGERETARSLLDEGLNLSVAADDDWNRGVALLYLGALDEDEDNVPAAESSYQAALIAFRGVGSRWGEAACLNRLGALASGETSAAYLRESLPLCAAMGHRLLGIGVLEGLARIALHEASPERAALLSGAATGLRQRLQTPREPAWEATCASVIFAARTVLSDAAFDAAWENGYRLDFDEALAAAGEP